jgi:hypothetical protein
MLLLKRRRRGKGGGERERRAQDLRGQESLDLAKET